MKLPLLLVSIALFLVAQPAQAFPAVRLSGAQFFNRCTSPPPDRQGQVVALCEVYVAGIADALVIDGKACIRPEVTQQQLFAVSLIWLQNSMAYGYRPAGYMIRNGLAARFPCRMVQARPLTPQEQIEQFVKIIEAIKEAKVILAALGML